MPACFQNLSNKNRNYFPPAKKHIWNKSVSVVNNRFDMLVKQLKNIQKYVAQIGNNCYHLSCWRKWLLSAKTRLVRRRRTYWEFKTVEFRLMRVNWFRNISPSANFALQKSNSMLIIRNQKKKELQKSKFPFRFLNLLRRCSAIKTRIFLCSINCSVKTRAWKFS